MENRKLKLVYDASCLKQGFLRSGSRSGVFFVGLNVLKELSKREDVELTLVVDPFCFYHVMHVLQKHFENTTFPICTKRFLTSYSYLRVEKIFSKYRGQHFKKFLLQIVLFFLSPVFKLLKKLTRKHDFAGYDVFLSPAYSIDSKVSTKKYTILHDLIPLKFPQYSSNKWQKNFWICDLCENLNKNDYYLAVSENTRKDFLKYFPKRIDSEKIRVISLGYDEKFKPYKVNNITTVKRKYGIPENKKYIFSLCTLDPRKNLLRVIKTFIAFVKKNNIDDTVFVLAGGHWEKFLPQLQNAVKELGEYSNRIIRTGYIDDEDLPILYNGASNLPLHSPYCNLRPTPGPVPRNVPSFLYFI